MRWSDNFLHNPDIEVANSPRFGSLRQVSRVMIDWSRAQTVLNEYVSIVRNGDAAFHVFYWGANARHMDNPVHRHSFFEVCYVLDGHGEYIDDSAHFSLRPQTLFLSRPSVWHQIRSQHGMLLWFVAFELDSDHSSPAVYARFQALRQAEHIFIPDAESTVLATLWRSLMAQTQDDQFLRSDVLSSTAMTLLLAVCPSFVTADDWARPAQRSSHGEQLIQSVETLIRDNLSQRLLLDQVAAYFHISGRQLSRLFAQYRGTTFSVYVVTERLREAVQLIEQTEFSISHIAEQTGFQSVHYFTNVFRRTYGVPPATYRRQHMAPTQRR